MSEFEVIIPKLGESIQEATITKLFVKVGDNVEEDDLLFEVATDKVDSEIPSPVSGKIKAILCNVDDLLAVGKVAMIIDLEGKKNDAAIHVEKEISTKESLDSLPLVEEIKPNPKKVASNRFYSPLVKSIAKKEGIDLNELDDIEGSGIAGRVQKNDLIRFIEERSRNKSTNPFAVDC